MTLPRRRGACPALSVPMETGDGLLVRLTPWDGALSPVALAGLAAAAQTFGNGLLEVTARGNLQLRGLRAATIGPLNRAVDALGIRAREGLALDVSPLAGLDAQEHADARPLADAVRAGIAALGIGGRLGPKVSVVIDGGGSVSLDALPADIRLKARDDGAWDLALAGSAQAATALGHIDHRDAADSVVALLTQLATHGPAARMADFLRGGRVAALASILPALSWLPRKVVPSPACGGGLGRGNWRGMDNPDYAEAPASAPSPALPRKRERELGMHGGSISLRDPPTPSIPLHPLADGTLALAIALPFGVADAGMMIALADAAAHHGARDLRPAPPRMIVAVGLSREGAAALARDAEQLGFIIDPADPRRSVMACPGAPACASGRIAARAMAPEIAAMLAPLLDGSVTVHVSGCAKGCARPAAATLTIVGRDAQGMDSPVGLVRQGNAGSPPDAVLKPQALMPAFARIAELAAERRTGESGAQFLSRLDLAALLEPSA